MNMQIQLKHTFSYCVKYQMRSLALRYNTVNVRDLVEETESVNRILRKDRGTYCLACSRDAYVTLTTAVSLSVFTERKTRDRDFLTHMFV